MARTPCESRVESPFPDRSILPKELRMNTGNIPKLDEPTLEATSRWSMRGFAIVAAVASMLALTGSTAWAQLLLEENFNYTAGTLLTANGWTAHSGTGTNAQTVTVPSLSSANYASSMV